MDSQLTIVFIAISFSLSFIGALIISKFGCRLGLIDNPNERSSHSIPTPRGGGIGIWAVVILSGIFIVRNFYFAFIIFAVGLIGLLEDRFNLPAILRLILQLSLSFIVVFMLFGIPYSILEICIFFFWIIFITGTANYYNFMDGINGIAGLTGVVGFGLIAYFSYFVAGNVNIASVGIILSLACLGFLPFNIPKARVFMGDVGSVLLGFMFAVMVMFLSDNILNFLCLFSFLFPFYADEAVTIYERIKRKESLFKPHRKHVYQILAGEKRIPHWKVSFEYALLQLVVGLTILSVHPFGLRAVLILLVVWFMGFCVLNSLLRKSISINVNEF